MLYVYTLEIRTLKWAAVGTLNGDIKVAQVVLVW
jgi:hypothetical protein